MQAKPKSNSVVTSAFDAVKRTLTFKVMGAGEHTLYLDRTSDVCDHRAMLQGYNQRCVNAAALPRNTVTGKSATPAEKFEAVGKLVAHFNSGTDEWSPAREATGASPDPVIVAALVEYLAKSEEDVRTMLAEGATRRETNIRTYAAALAAKSEPVSAIVTRMRAAQIEFDADEDLEAMK